MRAQEFITESIDADQVLDYVNRLHHNFDIEYSITDHPKWELKNIPLSQLKLDPDGEEQDPYNRVNWVDYDTVRDLMPKIGSVLKSSPIVVDPAGWIIDGNHRAMAAVEAGLDKIPAYVPVKSSVAEGSLNEYRDALYNFVKSKFPTWPEYVLKDFLYAQAKGIRDKEELKDFLDRNQKDFGQVKWRLEKLPIRLDIFTPKTQRMIKQREGGSSNPFQVPRDAERHAQQLKMIQQQGVRTEPIIVAKLSNGYDLIEGWHRTIQHLQQYPEGYTGPAWVAYGATYASDDKPGVPVKQDMTENMSHDQDGRAVAELKSALLAKRDQLQSATDDQVYDIIDKIMKRIARSHSISGQKLHDMWVDRYKQIPDTWVMNEDTEQKPVIIYTDHRGATIDDGIKNSLQVTQTPVDKLRLWEKHKSMQDPKVADWVTNKLLPELKQNGKLKPLLVWNNNGQFFVIDGNHRLIAYQEAGYRGRVPVQIVPDNMITVSDTVPGQQGVAEGQLTESAIFLNPNTVIVGQQHSQPLELSPETLKKVQAIAAQHGAWYEGNGADRAYTRGVIDRYVGSFDDEVAKTASPNDPKWIYVLFANVDANNRIQRVGVDPKDTIFNRLMDTAQDNSFQGIGFTASALKKFLSMASEGKYDFVKMSQLPATQENLTRFLKAGEALMWPSNWEQYPNRAGKIARAATVDTRDQYLATRKAGVYVVGAGHLKAVQDISGKQGVEENFADGKGPGRPGDSVRHGIPKKATMAELEKASHAKGRKGQLARWQLNMRRGKKK